jgi:hypothetical protein
VSIYSYFRSKRRQDDEESDNELDNQNEFQRKMRKFLKGEKRDYWEENDQLEELKKKYHHE